MPIFGAALTRPLLTKALYGIYLILAVTAVLATTSHLRANFRQLPPDLGAFYAAGRVVGLDKSSPYLAEPLYQREQETSRQKLRFVTPTPLPPYDLVALSAVSRLPLTAVVVLIALATLAAGAVTSIIITRCTSLPLAISVPTVFFGTVVSASTLGQWAPIAIAALAVAAWGARTNRGVVTGVALLVASIQPQMAAAAIVAALLYVPGARITLGLGILCLAIVPTAVMGLDSWIEYVKTLQLHALAELRFPGQYSLSWLLSALGAPPRIALGLGSASTLVAACLGFWLIARSREKAIASGAVIILPAMLSLIGGTFIHEYQVAFVVVAVILCVRPQRRWFDGTWAAGAMVVPFTVFISFQDTWPHGSAWGSILVRLATFWALLFSLNLGFGERFAATKSSLASACWLAIFIMLAKLRPHFHFASSTASISVPIHGSENASLGWAHVATTEGALFGHAPYFIAVKAVIWIAITVGAGAIARDLFPRFDARNAAPVGSAIS